MLAVTSLINRRQYLPFIPGDLREKFAFPMPYTDKHGKLDLSPKQTSKLVKWARPEEFMSQPTVLQVSFNKLTQQTNFRFLCLSFVDRSWTASA